MKSNTIKEAFEQVQAESILKDKTKDFVFQYTKGYKRERFVHYRYLACAFACIVFLLIGGQWLYFTPTVEISIDINPSIELRVNRFNRIISFESYNEDGEKLINSLDIRFMNYVEAINQIIESEDIVCLLADEEIMEISVIGTDSLQAQEIFSTVQACTSERNNTCCYYTGLEAVERAHEVGLSYGKYRAYLELQELDPTITVDDVQDMTMREIRDEISKLLDDKEDIADSLESESSDNRKQENRQGQGRRNRRRR